MKTYKVQMNANGTIHSVEMDLRPTEAKLLERVSGLLIDAIPDDWTSYMHAELIVEEI